MSWHADTALLRRYRSSELSDAHMASVELHVTTCPTCRSLAASELDAAGTTARERVKQRLDTRMDGPAPGRLTMLLEKAGVPEADAGLLRATLALQGSWVAASALAMAFVALATMTGPERTGLAAFLVVAPLVPLAGVAAAFGSRVDPAYEIALAAPLPVARVILLRSLAVTVPALPVIVLLSLFLPGGALAFAWLLPAVGLAGASLALGTVMALHRAAAAVAGLWTAAAVVALSSAPRTSAEAFVQGFAAFRPAGQVTAAAVAVVSLVLVALRRARFEIAR